MEKEVVESDQGQVEHKVQVPLIGTRLFLFGKLDTGSHLWFPWIWEIKVDLTNIPLRYKQGPRRRKWVGLLTYTVSVKVFEDEPDVQ